MSTSPGKVASQAEAAQAYMKKGVGRKPPSLVMEIIYGISLGMFAGYLWKMHHWNNQRRTRQFYDMLDKGLISTVVDEPGED
ncbi:Cytochrome c oxidase subunit 5c [Rhynchospora pubera]|uniref:Cytochrome c oxidase subunit 5c n=1 Tax=Rhynchospora pubera TaxID=906938 RepID=A0AAV8DXW7_9POAL|nr:Cytochrome c oxidase subunit 5c [Rhynchospora pubera]KAJ4778153.1 Cytochrome c oxidase subunit 5c [Rhynchospora pubera]KAJ4785018.1 Cytochrome c oxidase subunit 5c [Rhynchospora pubera]KAJ4802631.1 Cytochrome c oxidase subunit 5c [Rhynchospora pubera]